MTAPNFQDFLMERKARVNTKSAWKKILALFSNLDQKEGIVDHGMHEDNQGVPYYEIEVDGEYFGVYSLRNSSSRIG